LYGHLGVLRQLDAESTGQAAAVDPAYRPGARPG
jgi:hypothetical protein